MKHRTADLEGALLDAAVAKALGHTMIRGLPDGPITVMDWQRPGSIVRGNPFMPSSMWAQAGPLIEREHIAVWWTGKAWAATEFKSVTGYDGYGYIDVAEDELQGPTPLVAAMRAYVASKLGEEVDLP